MSPLCPLRTVTRRISEDPVRRSASRILRENVLCSIATVGPGNRAHINTAYFCASRDLDLFFLSDPTSRHCRNVAANPSAAVTVFRSAQTWGRPDRGLQLFGTCRELRGRAVDEAERLYRRRFPLYARTLSTTRKLDRDQATQLRTYRFYRFRPTRIKILDEAVFGGGVFVVAEVLRHRSV